MFANLLLCTVALAGDPVLFVSDDAPVGGDGLTWATAFRNVQDAIEATSMIDGHVQIWIEAGTYTPDRGTGDRSATFLLGDFDLFGGFAGVESSIEERRDGFETILSGDLLGDDEGGSTLENAHNVVFATNATSSVLDRLTIRGGRSDQDVAPFVAGAGLHVDGNAELEVRDCRFEANVARSGGAVTIQSAIGVEFIGCHFEGNEALEFLPDRGNGGAIFTFVTTSRFEDCTFVGNRAERHGGAVLLSNNSDVIFEGCMFLENEAAREGGGIYANQISLRSFPTIIDCVFDSNSASDVGGHLRYVGINGSILGSTFSQGRAASGGAIAYDSNATPRTLEACVFVENQALDLGGAIWNPGSGFLGVENVDFIRNQAARGGAASLENDRMDDWVHVRFEDNVATIEGGALHLLREDIEIDRLTFLGNRAVEGGAIACRSDRGLVLTMETSLFAHNQADRGGAIHIDILDEVYAHGMTFADNVAEETGSVIHRNEQKFGVGSRIERSIIQHNTEPVLNPPFSINLLIYNNTQLENDPFPGFVDRAGRDYRLTAFSPCIDEVQYGEIRDLAGLPRSVDDPWTPGLDIGDQGCFEFQESSCAVDLNEDVEVNIFDLIAFLADEPDWDGDPGFTIMDVMAFLKAFEAGC